MEWLLFILALLAFGGAVWVVVTPTEKVLGLAVRLLSALSDDWARK